MVLIDEKIESPMESGLLRILLMNPDYYDYITSRVSERHFLDPVSKVVFRVAIGLHDANVPYDNYDFVQEYMAKEFDIYKFALPFRIISGTAEPHQVDTYLKKVLYSYEKAETIPKLKNDLISILTKVESGKIDIFEASELSHNLLITAIDSKRKTSASSLLERLQQISNKIVELSRKEIGAVDTLIEFLGNVFMYRNAITLLQGGKGSFKSRLAEQCISSLYYNGNVNSAGFCAKIRNFKLLVIDTERSIKQFLPRAVQRIKQSAYFPLERDLVNFHPYSLIEIPRAERMTALKQIIEFHRKDFDGSLIVLVDVISDLQLDPNSIGETMLTLDYLNDLVNSYDVSFLVILHENPGTTINKARGHLGTEVTNKSSVVVTIQNKGAVEVKYLHVRESVNPGTFPMKFDDLARSLVPISESEAQAMYVDELTKFKNAIIDLLADGKKIPASELNKSLKLTLKISENTIKKYIDAINKNGDVTIKKEKQGKFMLYFIENKQLTAI